MRTLAASTAELAGTDADYQRFLQLASTLKARRDPLASLMSTQLEAAAYNQQPLNPAAVSTLVEEAAALMGTNVT